MPFAALSEDEFSGEHSATTAWATLTFRRFNFGCVDDYKIKQKKCEKGVRGRWGVWLSYQWFLVREFHYERSENFGISRNFLKEMKFFRCIFKGWKLGKIWKSFEFQNLLNSRKFWNFKNFKKISESKKFLILEFFKISVLFKWPKYGPRFWSDF